jgi:hypothetical protein
VSDYPVDIAPDGTRRLYVCMEDGVAKPVLEHMLGYALQQGYKQCGKPEPVQEEVPATFVAPEPVIRRGPGRPRKVE